jgi:serine/threonine protein kinase
MMRMCDVLTLFARLSIVHADLKPDNIIIDYNESTQEILSLKVIDLGSSFLLNPEGHVLEK